MENKTCKECAEFERCKMWNYSYDPCPEFKDGGKMMCKILFRGKRIDNGEWLNGSFCMDAIEQFNGLCGVDGFIRLYDKDSRKMQMYEIDRETVGQFTGLIDKNGKKIFEGDIVVYDNTPYNDYGHRVVGVIVWHKWMWKFRYKEYESTYHYSCGSENFFGAKSEVIGNIHDNPELLERGAFDGN